MFYVYILQSQARRKYYVGSTQDVANRLREHNAGESLSTRRGVSWEVMHIEEFQTRSEAVRNKKTRKVFFVSFACLAGPRVVCLKEGHKRKGHCKWLLLFESCSLHNI
jgi:putative endonuclease